MKQEKRERELQQQETRQEQVQQKQMQEPQEGYGRNQGVQEGKTAQEEQRKRLREFDRELFTYTGQIAWLLPGICSFILLILIAIPVQEMGSGDKTMVGMCFLFATWIPYYILLPYVDITDIFERKNTYRNRTYDKLKYLPVSRRQYIAVRMGYLFRFLWKLALSGLVLQCIFAVVSAGRVEPLNIVYVVAALLVTPLAAGWLLLQTWA